MKKAFFIIFIFSFAALAQEVHYLARSPYARLMGDAFTARADDEYTLYYNPAALGKRTGLDINPFNVELGFINPMKGITNPTGELDRFDDFPKDDAAAISERVMGFPIYSSAGTHPSLKFGPFGLSLFASASSNLILRNAIHPVLDVDYRQDRGFVFGFAHTLGRPLIERSKARKTGVVTSWGVSVKHMNRLSICNTFDLFGPELLGNVGDIDAKGMSAIREILGYGKGKAWGVDLGMNHSIVGRFSELSFGMSVLDVGDTQFKKTEGELEIPNQDMTVNLGASWRQNFTILDYSFNIDLKPLNSPISFGRKFHVGADIGIPALRLMVGMSEGYVSYGISTNLWLFKLLVGIYGVELGTQFREEQGKRVVIYLSLFDFSFDI